MKMSSAPGGRGPGRNTSRKVSLLRKMSTASSSRIGSGGVQKRRMMPSAITLPTLESARRITKDAQ